MNNIYGYEDYLLIENVDEINEKTPVKKKKIRKYNRKFKKLIIKILIITILIISIFYLIRSSKNANEINNLIIDEKTGYILTKGNHRYDKYGIDLNINVLNGMYNIGIDGDPYKNIKEWTLYTPPCPNLKPIIHSDYISNPKCEKSSLQFHNYENNDFPISLPLNDISKQIENFKEWKKNNNTNPYYGNQNYHELLNEDYHPYDYGYEGKDSSGIDDSKYYSKLVKSRMDEVPDPRRRRLFSFILFNSEFDLLDLYLSEYYNVVDYFVIYESNSTFSGHPKPLYFTRTLLETDRYNRYKDKLIPLPCEITVDEDNGRGKAFPKEHLARRVVIEKGLMSVRARHGDLFMHGDLDEFPKAHVLYRLKKCGGWEHIQAGIGGSPKSFKNGDVESYLLNKNLDVNTNKRGEYNIDYNNKLSLPFLAWFYEYSFNMVENKNQGTVTHPNLAIFDARRSLGQMIDIGNYKSLNKTKVKRSNYDPLRDPKFNPYQGYTYSVHHTDKKIGKGYLAERIRLEASNLEIMKNETRPLLWSSSWHMSSFLPTIDLFYNKIKSYSHFDTFSGNEEQDKKKIISRIKKHLYIFGKPKRYYNNNPILPTSYTDGYDYNFDYTYWKEISKDYNKNFNKTIDLLKREIPTQVWKNPICYSYMLEREYGFEKKLWWQLFPKENWKSIRFEVLNSTVLKNLTPKIISKKYQIQMFEEFSNKNN